MTKHLTHAEAHNFWRTAEGSNSPDNYAQQRLWPRSAWLVNFMLPWIRHIDKICEIGCNCGRNLEALRREGFPLLYGIEISGNALNMMPKAFPGLYRSAMLHHGPVEDILPEIEDRKYDAIFTLACLEHIHEDVENVVFDNMARVAKRVIVTIEDEKHLSSRHWPRNYKKVFTSRGFKQVAKAKPGADAILSNVFVARAFVRDNL